MPSGRALPAMATSSIHHGVSRLLVRIRISRLPNPLAAIACAIWSRASALASGATESSRSRIMPSAGRLRAFSSARAFDPGMNSRLRRGRIMDWFPSIASDPMSAVRSGRIRHISIILFEHGLDKRAVVRENHSPLFRNIALTVQPAARKTCSSPAHMVSHCHVIVPATSARRLSDLHLAAPAHRAIALPRTVRDRPVPRSDGDRLLRFPGVAGGDLRCRPRRIVRRCATSPIWCRSISRMAARTAYRRRWNTRSRFCASNTSWCSAMRNAAASAPSLTRSSRCRREISSADGCRCSSSRASGSNSATMRRWPISPSGSRKRRCSAAWKTC